MAPSLSRAASWVGPVFLLAQQAGCSCRDTIPRASPYRQRERRRSLLLDSYTIYAKLCLVFGCFFVEDDLVRLAFLNGSNVRWLMPGISWVCLHVMTDYMSRLLVLVHKVNGVYGIRI